MKSFHPPYLGAAYYPEDWPLEQIDADIAIMKEAGTNVMRIGEFAWSRMEPEEGRYDWDWLHLVVDKLTAAGIAVIMGTPTCSPPAWLTETYPEVLFIRQDGKVMTHGARRHACPNSPIYRQHCERIVTKMAEEFGRHDGIIGWQIDNEVSPSGRNCVCPVCAAMFRETMREKYGTIEKLNAAWGTDLWSQTYQSFEQLPTPDPQIWHHPSLLTAWAEFTSDSYVDFVKFQADILHRLTKHPIGTDMMPTPGVDYGDINKTLDVVQFNHYNNPENLWKAAFWFDLCRPLKDTPFWNTETSTCWAGNVISSGYKEPGFCRANSWLPIAMGAEMNLYWLWRQHWSGQELMHGAVVQSTGRPMHIFGEVQEISKGLESAAEFLNKTRPTSTGLALHYSHKTAWIFEYQPLISTFNYQNTLIEKIYHPMIQAQLRPDVILPMSDLSSYRVIISPFLAALDEADLRERLKSWIENGGTWIVGPMSDFRTTDATKYTHSPFGSLEEWAGIYCRYQIPGEPRNFRMRWADLHESEGGLWFDGFETKDTEAVAKYIEGPLRGLASITRSKMGKGQIIVFGTVPQPEDLRKLLTDICREAGVSPVAEASDNLVVTPRDGNGMRGMAVVEVGGLPASMFLPERMTDLLTGKPHEGHMELAPYTVMVLEGA